MKRIPENGGNGKQRVYWLDVARVVAIVSISINHAINRSYDNYTDQMTEYLTIPIASTYFKAFITVFSHLGVPIFLMLSGTLLLNKRIKGEKEICYFFRHNYLDLLITSEIWYFIMYWRLTIGQLIKNGTLSVSQFLKLVFGLIKTMLFIDQVTFDSTWYIPMILCIYLLIPIFALVLQRCQLRVFAIPCVIVFVSTMVFPNINSILLLGGHEYQINFALRSLDVFSVYFLYVFAGYWINRGGLSDLNNLVLVVMCGISFFACFAIQLYAYSRPMNYLVEYDFSLILVTAALLFECIRRFSFNEKKFGDVISYVSRISFGIYFVHILIMTIVNKLPIYDNWPRPLLLFFLEVVSFIGSIVIIRILSRIDILKRRMFLIKD